MCAWMSVACMYVCVPGTLLAPMEVRRGHRNPRNWSYRLFINHHVNSGNQTPDNPETCPVQHIQSWMHHLLHLLGVFLCIMDIGWDKIDIHPSQILVTPTCSAVSAPSQKPHLSLVVVWVFILVLYYLAILSPSNLSPQEPGSSRKNTT